MCSTPPPIWRLTKQHYPLYLPLFPFTFLHVCFPPNVPSVVSVAPVDVVGVTLSKPGGGGVGWGVALFVLSTVHSSPFGRKKMLSASMHVPSLLSYVQQPSTGTGYISRHIPRVCSTILSQMVIDNDLKNPLFAFVLC